MKFEHVPVPVGNEEAEDSAMMVLGGIAVSAVLVVVSSPRLFGSLAIVAGGIAGALALA